MGVTEIEPTIIEPIIEPIIDSTQLVIMDDTTIYSIVDTMPAFVGGENGMRNYISKSIKYENEDLCSRGYQGTVYVMFVVTKNGSIRDAKILRGIGKPADDLALNAVKNMPNWMPGKNRGEIVNVKIVLPIRIKLK